MFAVLLRVNAGARLLCAVGVRGAIRTGVLIAMANTLSTFEA